MEISTLLAEPALHASVEGGVLAVVERAMRRGMHPSAAYLGQDAYDQLIRELGDRAPRSGEVILATKLGPVRVLPSPILNLDRGELATDKGPFLIDFAGVMQAPVADAEIDEAYINADMRTRLDMDFKALWALYQELADRAECSIFPQDGHVAKAVRGLGRALTIELESLHCDIVNAA